MYDRCPSTSVSAFANSKSSFPSFFIAVYRLPSPCVTWNCGRRSLQLSAADFL